MNDLIEQYKQREISAKELKERLKNINIHLIKVQRYFNLYFFKLKDNNNKIIEIYEKSNSVQR